MTTATSSNTVWFSNFPNGRFANAAFQFWFASYLQQVRNYQVLIGNPEVPTTEIPWSMFNLPDHTPAISLLPEKSFGSPLQLSLDRSDLPEFDVLRIDQHFEHNPGSVLCVDGFFQYDTGSIALDDAYMETFTRCLLPSTQGTTHFQQVIWQYQQALLASFKSSYLVGLHVRRGDYLAYNNDIFFTLNLDQVVEQLHALFLRDHVLDTLIYVATDDAAYCKQYFSQKGLDILTSQDVLPSNTQSEVNCLAHDLAALSCAQLLVASNSSFSMLSALMNQRARIFWRQSTNGQLVSFDPWNTPILYGMYKSPLNEK